MDCFDIKLTATIAAITAYAMREPTKAVNIGNAVSGLQDLLTSSEYHLSGSYDFLTPEMITCCTGITDTGVLNQILAIWHEVPATKAPANPSPQLNDFNLYEALTKLLPSQFDMLEFLLEVPNGKRAPNNLQLSDRVVILLRYLNEQAGGKEKLQAEIAKSYPWLLKR